MTKKELLRIAQYGIEKKIKRRCKSIADTWASPANIADLKALLAQYDEIVQEYDAARKEEEDI